MPSPFPGMDPYLESAGLWQDVHHSLIYCIREALQLRLPTGYYALIEERIIVETSPHFYYPDVTVAREPAGPLDTEGEPDTPGGGVAVAVAADQAVEVEESPHKRQRFVEIRAESTGQVVTVMEVLSPANKAGGSRTYHTYLRKQTDVLASAANLVEIDLLRHGLHVLAVPESCLISVRPFDYLVCVHRAARPGVYQLYPRTVRQPLPRIALPLRQPDGDVVLDLQAVFQRCYDGAPYARLLAYHAAPPAPLSPEDTAWAEALLREKGLR